MAKRKPRRTGDSYDQLVIAGIILTLIAIVLYLWGPLHRMRGAREEKRPPTIKKIEPAPKQHATPEQKEGKTHEAGPPEKTAVVAIVIDDLGQDMKLARELLSLPAGVTFAVMPGLAQSRKIAELAKQNNREVLLHLPMEPKNDNGKPRSQGVLRSDMTPMEFMTTISDDIDSVPGAIGVNNHEGSALTENREAMKFLMAELNARGLFFLDSLTNPRSVAYATAKEFGLKAAKRDVFLDNESGNPKYIHGQLEELTSIAKKHGRAIGIGHPHPATITELKKWLLETDEQGIEIVPVSKLMQ